MNHEQPPVHEEPAGQVSPSPDVSDSWEQAASQKKAPDPMPFRLAGILAIGFGVFNALFNTIGLYGHISGQSSIGGLGEVSLVALLAFIGILQIVCGVFMLKAIRQPEVYRPKCRQLGIGMLIITVAYMVPVFMIRARFVTNTLFGPIVSVVYLTVQRAWEKKA